MWAVHIPTPGHWSLSPSLPLSIFSPDTVLRKPRVMSCRAFDVAIASHIDATDQAGAACLQIEVSGDNLIDGRPGRGRARLWRQLCMRYSLQSGPGAWGAINI